MLTCATDYIQPHSTSIQSGLKLPLPTIILRGRMWYNGACLANSTVFGIPTSAGRSLRGTTSRSAEPLAPGTTRRSAAVKGQLRTRSRLALDLGLFGKLEAFTNFLLVCPAGHQLRRPSAGGGCPVGPSWQQCIDWALQQPHVLADTLQNVPDSLIAVAHLAATASLDDIASGIRIFDARAGHLRRHELARVEWAACAPADLSGPSFADWVAHFLLGRQAVLHG